MQLPNHLTRDEKLHPMYPCFSFFKKKRDMGFGIYIYINNPLDRGQPVEGDRDTRSGRDPRPFRGRRGPMRIRRRCVRSPVNVAAWPPSVAWSDHRSEKHQVVMEGFDFYSSPLLPNTASNYFDRLNSTSPLRMDWRFDVEAPIDFSPYQQGREELSHTTIFIHAASGPINWWHVARPIAETFLRQNPHRNKPKLLTAELVPSGRETRVNTPKLIYPLVNDGMERRNLSFGRQSEHWSTSNYKIKSIHGHVLVKRTREIPSIADAGGDSIPPLFFHFIFPSQITNPFIIFISR